MLLVLVRDADDGNHPEPERCMDMDMDMDTLHWCYSSVPFAVVPLCCYLFYETTTRPPRLHSLCTPFTQTRLSINHTTSTITSMLRVQMLELERGH